MLRAYGFPLPQSILAKNPAEAAKAAKKIGYPVVMKIASPQIIHKSDAGGVKVGLANEQAVKDAFDVIIKNAKKYNKNAQIKGVLVQEMVKGGKELIIGSKQEPGFGQVIMLGMGGIYVEVLKDVTFRLAPVTNGEAEDMINSIRTKKLLEGVRGEKPADKKKEIDLAKAEAQRTVAEAQGVAQRNNILNSSITQTLIDYKKALAMEECASNAKCTMVIGGGVPLINTK